MIYKLIGMAVVKFTWAIFRREAVARKALVAGVGTAAVLGVAAATAGYLLTRETPEA